MAVNAVFKVCFDSSKGIECERCMLSFMRQAIKGETRLHCAGLGQRPICPEEGCRKDCPLVIVED